MDAAKREIAVSVPDRASCLKDAQRFVDEKRDWIDVQLELLPPAQPFVDGGTLLFQGKLFTLACPGSRGRARSEPDTRKIIVPAPQDTLEGRTKRFLIRQAREALTQCTHYHAGRLGKQVHTIRVRDTSSRWGSCVTRKSGSQLSYSWRLICAPPFVLDYVCAHECAHLIEPNHSRAFWDVCNGLVDTVKPAKRWLSQNGDRLHAVGARY